MRRIAAIRPIAICAALSVLSPMTFAAEKEKPAPGPEARPTMNGCEANLREFRQSLKRSEYELSATALETDRRAILRALLDREDFSTIVRCLAAARKPKDG